MGWSATSSTSTATDAAAQEAGRGARSGFFHGLGHGVGLEVHEPPWLPRSGDELVAGDVITLEPGLYRAGSAASGSRTSCSSPTTAAEVLTDYPYDLEP